MPDSPTTALVKTAQSPALARVSSQLALTDKLLTKPEEPFLIPYRKGHLWGYCDISGKMIIECKYFKAELFCNKLATVVENHRELTINLSGKTVTKNKSLNDALCTEMTDEELYYLNFNVDYLRFSDEIYCDERVGLLSEELQAFCENDKIGFKDKDGKIVIFPTYDDGDENPDSNPLPAFHEGLAKVYQGNAYGFIDKTGNIIIPFIFSVAGDFSNGLAAVAFLGSHQYDDMPVNKCYINLQGEIVIPSVFGYAGDFKDNLAIVSVKNKFGYINSKGNNIIPCEFDSVQGFEEGLSIVSIKGKYGCIDITGKYIVRCNFDYIEGFQEGLSVAVINGKYGYINKLGDTIINFQYDDARSFSEGFASVEPKSKYGYVYIDKSGMVVIQKKFSIAYDFHDGIAHVGYGYYRSFINKKGDLLLPYKYENVLLEKNDIAFVCSGPYYNLRKLGYVNLKSGIEYWEDQ